jgi:hypothetical protein
VCGAAITLFAVSVGARPANAQHVAASWTNKSTGFIDGVGFTIAGLTSDAATLTRTFTGSNYAAGELGSVRALTYATQDAWTINFAAPVASLRIYAEFWRGRFINGQPIDIAYSFSSGFSILSGFSGVSVIDDGFVLPGTSFHSGVLEFTGSLTSLSVQTSGSPNGSLQNLTFAGFAAPSIGPEPPPTVSVPEPHAVALLVLGLFLLIPATRARRSVSA